MFSASLGRNTRVLAALTPVCSVFPAGAVESTPCCQEESRCYTAQRGNGKSQLGVAQPGAECGGHT